MQKILRLLTLVAALVMALIVIGAPTTGATGEEPDIVYVIEDAVYKGEEGEVIEIGSFEVPDHMAGRSCVVTIIGDNNEQPSPHPYNDLVLQTGNQTLEAPDFEREPYQITEVTERLMLGEEVTISLRFGPDKKSSGGVVVELDDCVYLAYLPLVIGQELPRGEALLNSTVYCSPESNLINGFAWAKNTSTAYWVDVEVQFSGWGFGSARLQPGEEHTFQIDPNINSVPAGIVYISLEWENGDMESFEVLFEGLDCNPPGWVIVHTERDPWVWSTQLSWEFIPMWFEPPQDELRLVTMPLGRQEALRAHGHLIEYDIVSWYDQQFVNAVYLDGDEIETTTGEITEIVIQDENGINILAIFVGEGCGTNECQNVTTWWRSDPTATGLLVDIANEW